jgi:hypothetical protein
VLATKPGRVREMIDVPLPRPRDFSQQMGNEFLELKQHVRGLIHDEAARNTGFAPVLRCPLFAGARPRSNGPALAAYRRSTGR